MLEKTRFLMNIGLRTGSTIGFVNYDADDPADEMINPRDLVMYVPDWEDLGSPEVITVTIEPGDHLN